jgi:hypothetical protein
MVEADRKALPPKAAARARPWSEVSRRAKASRLRRVACRSCPAPDPRHAASVDGAAGPAPPGGGTVPRHAPVSTPRDSMNSLNSNARRVDAGSAARGER